MASCEDNLAIRDSLTDIFAKIKAESSINLKVDFFINGEELLNVQDPDYDVYLLDMNMGEDHLNGMELAYKIREFDEKAIIMFLTSEKKYIQEGYKVRAYRYLTKPVSYAEFKTHFCCAVNDIERKNKRYINVGGKYTKYNKISLDDVYYIETNGRKTIIHTVDGDMDCMDSISSLTAKLKDRNFYRCHNSFLVNLDFVEEIDGRYAKVRGKYLTISRNKVKDFEEIINRRDKKRLSL